MPAKVKQIIAYLEELAPASLAMPGDSVGLQVGNPEAQVNKMLVSLDPDRRAVDEAISIGAEMLVTHHPLLYHKLSSLDESIPPGPIIFSAVKKGLNIFCAHTNFDLVPGGVSYHLAQKLDLPVKNYEVIKISGREELLKLVVFVPAGHEDSIRSAISDAGAGQIGRYSHCAFQVAGTGSYLPGNDTKPYIGTGGRLEEVSELRLETILPAKRRKEVIDALLHSHPYEEVAYDLYPLSIEGATLGLGLIIELDQPRDIEHILQLCRERLNAADLRYWVSNKCSFSRIALCGGSGGSLIEDAAKQAAELFISGDFRYHDLKTAQSLDIALIDAGHDATEWPAVDYLKDYLAERLKSDGYETEVHLQASVSSGWI